ncbi:MAG TPA: IclR family transcriptional regulator [Rhizomicrobium sp.]|mgnify:CR=1 FL=1|jgi:DNA-binding IclR family transcriptional regulator|nr:IclR family transcriptional regulator [Rhizomicrobium sp.]
MATPTNLSVQKAFALLRSFRGPTEWLTNAELSRRSGLPEPSAHRLMKTLEEIGAVVRDRRGCYRPGMVLATLSRDVAIGDLIRATSEDVLRTLAADLKGVVHVGVLENGMVTYAAKFGESAKVLIPSCVGAQQEAYCSAVGKILLAGLSPHQFEDFLHDGDFVALTPQTITSVGSLRSEIAGVQERGYAVDNREVCQTICCVGAPIRDPNGNIAAAISFADTAMNFCSTWQEEVLGGLVSATEKISRKIFPVYQMTAH